MGMTRLPGKRLSWRGWAARFEDESPLLVASGLALLCLPIIAFVTWGLTERWQDGRIASLIQRHSQLLARQLNDVEIDIERSFSHVKNVTNWVAHDRQVARAILDPARSAEANALLHEMNDTFAVDLIYVMNAEGISVAASNADTPASTVGLNYSDREHFQKAIQGLPGSQFAVGRTTRVPGFFFSMPVRHGDRIIGTVGVKLDQPNLQQQAHVPDGLLVDLYGVVVMADNPAHMFRTLPDINLAELPEKVRQSRYARIDFEPLALQSAGIEAYPQLMLLDGRMVLIGTRALVNDNLTLYLMADMEAIPDIQRQTRMTLIVGSLMADMILWGLLATLIYYLRARDYHRRLEAANTELSRLNAELKEQATHDYLTGALNRRALSIRLATELERNRRYDGQLSLAVLDIDFFKQINDRYGHAVGDRALQFLVESLSRQLRRTDVLARVGGEEFALLMPDTQVEVAAQAIDRMRDVLSSMPVPLVDPPLKLTFSAGVAGWQKNMSENALFNAADHALYAAKAAGRNRVHVASAD